MARGERARFWSVRLAVLLQGLPLAAATYYVAPPPAGSDANPGTVALPWSTLQHAASQVGPGDTVLVRAGDYTGFQLTTSGAPGARIAFRAYPGERPAIVADNPVTPDGINLEGASHVTIEGFRVDGRGRAGIRAVLCREVEIRGNTADANARWGIFTGCCEDLTIEYNITSGSLLEHGIYVSNSGDRPLVRGNLAYQNRASGLHMNGDLSVSCDGFLATDGIITDALVEGNILAGNGLGGGSGINCDGVQGSTIRNNLVAQSLASGISLYRIDGGAPSSGNTVVGNTVHVAALGRWGLNVQDGSAGTVVRNNIFWSDHSLRGAMNVCASCLAGFSSDFNAVEDRFTLDGGGSVLTLAQWRTATGQDVSSFVATPAQLFADAANLDYHLRPGSPAEDAGVAFPGLVEDLAGSPRPLGEAVDIGALEAIFGYGFERGSLLGFTGAQPLPARSRD
jgi:hypothetical protein